MTTPLTVLVIAACACAIATTAHAEAPAPLAHAASAADARDRAPAHDALVSSAAPRATKPPTLDAIEVTATLDRARNALSPGTGSSQYVINQKAIDQLPLGASTPLNQVLLQAPGVVQDSFGQLHVRGDHANLQYRINGVILPESIAGFGQTLDARTIQNLKLLDGALPAQYGERTAAVVDLTTRNGFQLGNGGNLGVTGGAFGTFNPHASLWGHQGRWSWYLTGNYLESDLGIENPTPSRKAIHDRTHQLKAFGDLTFLVNADTRLGFLFGLANNRFEIPNRPGQHPEFGYLDEDAFDSARLDERQRENTRFAALSLQGKAGATDYEVSLANRVSAVDFTPDRIGDLMFNGIASRINQVDRASTLQADFSTPLGARHTLRYGLWYDADRAGTANGSQVFPANGEGEQTSTVPIAIDTFDAITATTLAAYVQDEWQIHDDWTLNFGLRGDRYRAFGATARQLSPRLGVVWQATPTTTVHAGYARYFTPPATELISARDIALFDDTTNAVEDSGHNTPLASRSNYFDVGVQQTLGEHLTLGLDTYYNRVTNLQDEGQFGAALIYSTFNYARGRVRGAEFTATWSHGPWSAYFNLAYSRAMGKRVITSQYNFDPVDLAYLDDHFIHLDHDQKYTSSGSFSYAIASDTRIGANYLFGTGLRRDGLTPNGLSLPDYFQLNLSLSHVFATPRFGPVRAQLAVINALDHVYELRDGTGIGVGAPQFGPRRGLYLGVSRDF